MTRLEPWLFGLFLGGCASVSGLSAKARQGDGAALEEMLERASSFDDGFYCERSRRPAAECQQKWSEVARELTRIAPEVRASLAAVVRAPAPVVGHPEYGKWMDRRRGALGALAAARVQFTGESFGDLISGTYPDFDDYLFVLRVQTREVRREGLVKLLSYREPTGGDAANTAYEIDQWPEPDRISYAPAVWDYCKRGLKNLLTEETADLVRETARLAAGGQGVSSQTQYNRETRNVDRRNYESAFTLVRKWGYKPP